MPVEGFIVFERKIVVGIAEFVASNNPMAVLTTYSLGSCLGIAVYDSFAKVGGMLHAMLPDSRISREKASARPGMFIDTGMPALLEAVEQLHGAASRLRISVAGGGQIMDSSGFFSIGKRNYDALKAFLDRQGLRIHAEEIGGLVNRTMHLRIATGEVSLKVSGESQEKLLC